MSSASPAGSPTAKKNDVLSRLTDTSKYTGAHKARFDDDGKGMGIAGRRDVVEFKGNTNTPVVDAPITAAAAGHKPVVTVPLGKEKFGTQAAKAATIKLYRNGDKHHAGETLTLRGVKTLEQVLDKASTLVKLPTGAVRKIYKSNLKSSVKAIEEFEDGGVYLCCGGEKPAEKDKLPAVFV